MKICYLSSSALGNEMFQYLKSLNPEITYYNLENERMQCFDNIDYDLGISFLYTYKIPASEFFKKKIWLNFHPGPLPEYKGRNLCYHAIMEGAEYFGATLHYMDENFDTGEIIKVLKFPIAPHYTAGELSELSRKALVTLFKEYIPRFVNGEIVQAEKQVESGRYFKQRLLSEEVIMSEDQQKNILALTVAPQYYAYTIVRGKKFLIIPQEEWEKRIHVDS